MTELTKPVRRKTPTTIFERSKMRRLIVAIEPAGRKEAQIGIRLEGTLQTYRIGLASIYNLAVSRHLAKIEKEAKKLHKDEKIPMRSARARARKELNKELKQ